jgi:hypothetical protein
MALVQVSGSAWGWEGPSKYPVSTPTPQPHFLASLPH